MLRIRLRCASPKISIRSRHSRRTVPIRRSAYPFCQGDLGEIGRSRITNRRQFGAIRTEPGNPRLRRTAWWAREACHFVVSSTTYVANSS
jgi:hypothetical protein